MKRIVSLAVLIPVILVLFVIAAPASAQTTPQPATAMRAAQSADFDAAMKLYRRRHFAEAIQALEAVLQSEPGNAAAHYFKGYAQYVTGHYSDAQASFDQAFQADSSFDPRPYFYRH